MWITRYVLPEPSYTRSCGGLAPMQDSDVCLKEGERLYQKGRYSEALARNQQAHTVSVEAHDPSSAANALAHLGRDAQAQGRLRDARRYYEQALAIRRETGPALSVAYIEEILGGLHMLLGEYAEAWQTLNESLRLRKEGNEPASSNAKPTSARWPRSRSNTAKQSYC